MRKHKIVACQMIQSRDYSRLVKIYAGMYLIVSF